MKKDIFLDQLETGESAGIMAEAKSRVKQLLSQEQGRNYGASAEGYLQSAGFCVYERGLS